MDFFNNIGSSITNILPKTNPLDILNSVQNNVFGTANNAISTAGNTASSLISGASNTASSLFSNVGSIFSSLTSFLPYILLIVGAVFVYNFLSKK